MQKDSACFDARRLADFAKTERLWRQSGSTPSLQQIAKTLNLAQKKGELIPQSLPQPESLEYALELMETILAKLTEVRLALSGVKQSENPME